MVVGGAIISPQGIAPVVLEVVVVVEVADIARFTLAVGAALLALALRGVAKATVAVFIDLAFQAPAPPCIADTTATVVIDLALHAPALAGVADPAIAAVVINVALHAPVVVRVAGLLPRTSTVASTGAEADVVVAEVFITQPYTAAVDI